MKKVIIMPVMLIFFYLMSGATIEVDIEGTGDYTSIQDGINASSDGDTVLVYPGRYFEHINFIGKMITVGSLNLTTGESHYIHETIIDGSDNGSCVRVSSEEAEGTTIHGFTLINGAGDFTHPNHRAGGGILLLESSHLRVINCFITRNRASDGGGILAVLGRLYLEGTTICYNKASQYYSGGITTISMLEVVFSEKNRCSIYNNYGPYANDVCNRDSNNNTYTVIVDTFTVLHPDLYFILGYFDQLATFYYYEMDYNILNSYITEVDNDLYVALDGNDTNSGENPGEPLRTIADALIRAHSDAGNPHAIHLAAGTYSAGANEQILPLHLKEYITLEGAGMYETIIDGEDYNNMLIDRFSSHGYAVRDISFENAYSRRYQEPFASEMCCRFDPRNEIQDYLLLENVRFAYCGDGFYPQEFNYYLIYCERSITLHNVIMEDNESRILGIRLQGSASEAEPDTVNFSNVIMRNNYNFRGLYYSSEFNPNDRFNIINMEYTGNYYEHPEYPPGGTFVLGFTFLGPSRINIINSTFSDNNTPYTGSFMSFYYESDIVMLNTIISGYPDLAIRRAVYGEEQDFLIDHCLIEGGYNDIQGASSAGLVYGYVLEGEPFFDSDGDYPYSLDYISPCLGTGTLELPEGIELPEYDYLGNPRILGSNIDMGAYEWNGLSAYPWGSSTGEEIISFDNELYVYPNPIIVNRLRDGKARIEWKGEKFSGNMNFEIFNVKGQFIRELKMGEGNRTTYWDGKDSSGSLVNSGVYFVLLNAAGYRQIKKVVLIK
ncbi:MAG: DUF1565 domain-containing protein [Candidatus Cloacimonetes bacterium]|nr:DUF1565 domain-containing protein [Candidatus Cloacimonadota bacterium]